MRLNAPWTQQQVDAINEFQKLGFVHEFTCGEHSDVPLHACSSEMYCSVPHCGYSQTWVHDFMADKSKHPKKPFGVPGS